MPTSSRTSRRTRKPRRRYIDHVKTLSSIGPVTEAGTATVCGVEYRIVEGGDLMTHNSNEDAIGVRGAVNPYVNTVMLDRVLGKSQKELTLLHELIHAIDDALNLGLTERQTGLLGAGLYGLQYTGPKKNDKTRTMRGVFYD